MSDLVKDTAKALKRFKMKPDIFRGRKRWQGRSGGIHPEIERHVYFARDGELVKIGFSQDVYKRMMQIRADRPEARLVYMIKGGCDVESSMHRVFIDRRIEGEWFRVNDQEIADRLSVLGISIIKPGVKGSELSKESP